MAVQLESSIKRYRGLSTDQKPGHDIDVIGDKLQTPPVGSTFTETDTGKRFIWTGSWPWTRQEQTIETILMELIEVNSQILSRLEFMSQGYSEFLEQHGIELAETF